MFRASGLTSLSIAGLLLAAASGCSDFQSSFAPSKRTLALIPEAQSGQQGAPGVTPLVDEKFGDPQHLKAWMKLPVEWGGKASSVSAFEAGDQPLIRLTVDEESPLPEKAGRLVFTSGTLAGKSFEITSWDSSAGTAILASAPDTAPEAGDSCTVDAGRLLQSGRVLYMRHCSHCHGTAGDGNGPTAQYLYPKPRDYRHGVFKFTSTIDSSRATRDDLLRVLKYGIPGTYMPSFLLMKDEELQALVEYVRFLAMRGEYERKLVNELASDYSSKAVESRLQSESRGDVVKELQEFLGEEMAGIAESAGDELAETWTVSEAEESRVAPSVPRVEDTPESRQRGRDLYLGKALNCANCHGIDGAGNGPQTIAFEKNPETDELYGEAGLHDVWGNLNQPRNLQTGIFRGGRRPIDVFNRIYAGIKGSSMPAFKNTPHEDIWHVVNYVLSLQFESEPGAAGTAPAEAVASAADGSQN
ncbi:MAG: c-type cytochrome [Planctomycetaceae bacterium]